MYGIMAILMGIALVALHLLMRYEEFFLSRDRSPLISRGVRRTHTVVPWIAGTLILAGSILEYYGI